MLYNFCIREKLGGIDDAAYFALWTDPIMVAYPFEY